MLELFDESSVYHDPGLVSDGCEEYENSVTAFYFLLEYANQIPERTVRYGDLITRPRLVADSHKAILSDALADNLNNVLINRSGGTAKAEYSLNAPREADFVEQPKRVESSEDVSGKQTFDRVNRLPFTFVIATLSEFRV